MTESSSPLFEELQYCVRCCIPETEEGTNFDELGICQACRSSEEKMHIDWAERERELRRILDDAKAQSGDNYDCIVPVSGGKDSTFQLHVITNVYGMKPLAVTFSHNWYSETGWYNLVNSLETFGVDHIMFTPSRSLVNRLAKRSLSAIGDACWHCHAGIGAFPLQVAIRFNIPLLIYGEPAAEGHGMASYTKPMKYDREYFQKVSAKVSPKDMVDETLSLKDMKPFQLPTDEQCAEAGIQGIHLGDYIFWDDERQMEFVRDTYGWRETQMEGTYKGYKSAECIMPGVHDFTWYLKRGYARASSHASIDVRNGLLSREEGLALARRHDPERPEALDYFLKVTGMTEEDFYEAMKGHRVEQLKDVEMPVWPKSRPNAEKIQPVAEQLMERFGQPTAAPSARGPVAQGTDPLSLFDLSIRQILEGYERNDFSPLDIAQLCVDQFTRLEPQSQSWVKYS